ncbi:hypothetical protein B0O80DRAFT_404273, partial [Mortierella sp. GBAus27b]
MSKGNESYVLLPLLQLSNDESTITNDLNHTSSNSRDGIRTSNSHSNSRTNSPQPRSPNNHSSLQTNPYQKHLAFDTSVSLPSGGTEHNREGFPPALSTGVSNTSTSGTNQGSMMAGFGGGVNANNSGGTGGHGYQHSKYRYSDEVDEDEQPLLLHDSPSFSTSSGSEATRGNNNIDQVKLQAGDVLLSAIANRTASIPILAAIGLMANLTWSLLHSHLPLPYPVGRAYYPLSTHDSLDTGLDEHHYVLLLPQYLLLTLLFWYIALPCSLKLITPNSQSTTG